MRLGEDVVLRVELLDLLQLQQQQYNNPKQGQRSCQSMLLDACELCKVLQDK
jgi:hypothetical protein